MSLLTLTATALRLDCDRRIWLDHHPSQPLDLQRETAIPKIEEVQKTLELMKQGVHRITDAVFEGTWNNQVRLLAQIDHLVRHKSAQGWVYYPLEIKSSRRLAEADLLQMDVYLWLLSQIQGVTVPGLFWLGRDSEGRPLDSESHYLNMDRLEIALQHSLTLLQGEIPPIEFKEPCKTCHWLGDCSRQAGGKTSIIVLPELRQETQQALQAAQITCVEDMARLTPMELRQFRGIGKVTAPHHLANAQAWASGKPVWIADLPEVCQQEGLMFDLETFEDNDIMPWSWGLFTPTMAQVLLLVPGMKSQEIPLSNGTVVHCVSDTRAAWEKLAEMAGQRPIYHWTSFDAGIVKRNAPADLQARLLSHMVDLHQVFKATVKLPIRSSSIKAVAPYLGFSWSGYASWSMAYLDYQRWCQTQQLHFLERSCAYQMDDVKALHHVWSWLKHSPRENQ